METAIKDLFVRFITDDCTTEEQAQVLDYIRAGRFESEWEAALLETEKYFPEPNVEFNEAKVFKRISIQTGAARRHDKLKWLGYAAAVLICGTLAPLLLKKDVVRTPVLQQAAVMPAVTSKKQWIKLDDGTSVQLNKNSKLIYPESFQGKKLREVTLIGEAFFDVKHMARQPFVIHTGKITTTVLGTAFNISAYKAGEAVTVTVKRGRVRVQNGTQTLAVLTPDQQLAWSAQHQFNEKQPVKSASVLAWMAGDLIIDDLTLEEAAGLIANRYQLKVNFKNEKIRACRLSAAFLERNEIGQVLRVVGEITGTTLQLKNGVITIEGEGC